MKEEIKVSRKLRKQLHDEAQSTAIKVITKLNPELKQIIWAEMISNDIKTPVHFEMFINKNLTDAERKNLECAFKDSLNAFGCKDVTITQFNHYLKSKIFSKPSEPNFINEVVGTDSYNYGLKFVF